MPREKKQYDLVEKGGVRYLVMGDRFIGITKDGRTVAASLFDAEGNVVNADVSVPKGTSFETFLQFLHVCNISAHANDTELRKMALQLGLVGGYNA